LRIYPRSLHDALPIFLEVVIQGARGQAEVDVIDTARDRTRTGAAAPTAFDDHRQRDLRVLGRGKRCEPGVVPGRGVARALRRPRDRKSTRLNSSHVKT